MAIVYLGLGSNIGDTRYFLLAATQQIQNQVGTLLRASAMSQTMPWGVADIQPPYLNQIICIDTQKTPLELLSSTQQIEKNLGRTDKGGYKARTIDIDILYYDNLIINTPQLTIPHPLAHLRNFILDQMLEIAPTLIHPIQQKTQQELAEML